MKLITGRHLWATVLIAVVVLLVGCGGNKPAANAGGEEKKKPTTAPYVISAPEIHDDECVEDIEKAVGKLDGVDVVEVDRPKLTVRVYPKEGVTLSAKLLWETFESISFDKTTNPKITKIDGPTGVFTSKPDK
jgi:copper chaperone CopZ